MSDHLAVRGRSAFDSGRGLFMETGRCFLCFQYAHTGVDAGRGSLQTEMKHKHRSDRDTNGSQDISE